MAVRYWLVATVAVLAANAGAFAQQHCGGGQTNQMKGGHCGQTNQLRGNPGQTNQLQGSPLGVSQLQTAGGVNALQAQQMYLQAQLQAQQQMQTADLLSYAANQGYAEQARAYAAYKKRQRELKTTTVADLIAEGR
ncbi:MAG: hypothetical protein ABGY75_05845, partial [Gemmataceae bacterium]